MPKVPMVYDTPRRVGRPPRWLPDALIVIRAKDESTIETVAQILRDALSSHPESVRVLFDARPEDPLTDAERDALANATRFIAPG